VGALILRLCFRAVKKMTTKSVWKIVQVVETVENLKHTYRS